MFPAKRKQQERFLKTDELVEGIRTMAEAAEAPGAESNSSTITFQQTEQSSGFFFFMGLVAIFKLSFFIMSQIIFLSIIHWLFSERHLHQIVLRRS